MKLLKGDCLELMKSIPSNSVDLILCDPPYNVLTGYGQWAYRHNIHDQQWDVALPFDKVFKEYERIVKASGAIILFSIEPLTSRLRTMKLTNIDFKTPLIWLKYSNGGALYAKTAPTHYFEDISVFRKLYDRDMSNPLRTYAKHVKDFIGKSAKAVQDEDNDIKIQHFYTYAGMEFGLPTRHTYQRLVEKYHVDKLPDFMTYDQMVKVRTKYNGKYRCTFNSGGHEVPNVLKYHKEKTRYHPTQKPVALLKRLVDVYSNPGDVVLDNCMGSGSTGVACQQAGRRFIGMEKDGHYFKVATERLKESKAALV